MSVEWIDSHTHLEHEYPFSVDEYVENASRAGVHTLITVGTKPGFQNSPRLNAEKYDGVYFSVGIHPHEANDFNEDSVKEMDLLRVHPKCVAVGETGLDYWYNHSARDKQLEAFERQLELARLWNKPVIIHARSAEDDVLEKLSKYVSHLHGTNTPGVIHCFSGSRRFAEESLRLGFYISFSGIVTFNTAEEIRGIARDLVPLDKILIETDSPYLAPIPYRGKPNQSAYMVETAKQMCKLKGVTIEEFSRATVANTRRLFGIPTI